MKNKDVLIEQLKTTPVIQVACQKVGIGRASYYRWLKEDEDFRQKAESALKDGVLLVNDLAESQLIAAMKDGNMTAIIYWLKSHHPSYSEKIVSLPPEDLKEIIRVVNSPNLEKGIKSLIHSAVKGRISKQFLLLMISSITKIFTIKKQQTEEKKIDLLSRIKKDGVT